MKPIQTIFTLRSFFLYIILSLLFTTPLFLSGQNITLSNQAQVDTFSLTEVNGSLTISGADITNLDSLSALTSVASDFIIDYNVALLNLDGLAALTSVGGELRISHNNLLLNIDGLAALTSVNFLSIQYNIKLLNIDGLEALTSVAGDLRIEGNIALLNIDGLAAITTVGGVLLIHGNTSLNNLDGLAAITSLTGSLIISSNPGLMNLDGLPAITTVAGDLSINGNASLNNLDGLAAITTVGGDLRISNSPGLLNLDDLAAITTVGGDLRIDGNTSLNNLDGLAAITSLTGSINISNNPGLMNLDGLSMITAIGLNLYITDNDALLNLDGLTSITSVPNRLFIIDNDALLDLDGLESITSVNLVIIQQNNLMTSFCGLFPLIDGGSYNNASITGNAVNPTASEIIANGACVSLTCPSDSTFYTDSGVCCATITLVPPTIQGGNSTTTLVNDYNNTSDASDTYFVMTTEVTWTATDAYGNQSSCIQNIIVMDNEAPQFGVPDPSCSMYQSCYDTQTLALSNNETTYQQALAACSGDPVCIQAATQAKSKELEEIRKAFQSCLDGNTNCSLVPVSGALPDLIVSGGGDNCEAQVDNPGPVVAENCAAFILTNDYAIATNALGSGIYPEGTTTVTWTATDQFGNVSTITRNIIVTTENCGSPYCESMGNSTEYEWIDMISINGISNQSGNDYGYADFSQIILPMATGNNSVQLTPGFAQGNYREYWRIYIDFNQDDDFDDPGELVYSKKSFYQIQSSFDVPMTALEGTTGMRISMSYNGWPSPCDIFEEGEVEDYTVDISFCENLTDGGLIGEDQVLCDGENDPSEIMNLDSPSGGAGPIEYLWLKNTTTSEPPTAQNMNGWVELSNSNVASYDPETISTTTWYLRCARNEGCIQYSAESNVVEVAFSEECSIEYCESQGISTDYEWIKKVKLTTINNNTGNNGGYADFTNLTAEVDAGDDYSLKLKPGFSGNSYKEYWRVWIDWNQDGDFEDADELVVQTTSNGPSTFTRWIDVPSDAINGNTRMRVSMKYGSYAGSCESFDEGEVEDYTVNVSEGQSFTGNPPNDNNEIDTRNGNQNDITELNVNVYPNPTTGLFSLDILSNIESMRNVQIFNQLGQAVYTNNSVENSIRIDMKENKIPSGHYIIMISENNRVITKQLHVIR